MAESVLSVAAPWGVLAVLAWGALLTALLARVAFAVASPRRLAERARQVVLGALIGFWLFRGEPSALFRQVARLMRGSALLAAAALPPLLLMLLPAVALFVALERRAAYERLRPGDVTFLTAECDAASVIQPRLVLRDGGVTLERAARFGDLCVWRLRVEQPGVHRLLIDISGPDVGTDGRALVFPLVAEPGHAVDAARTNVTDWLSAMFESTYPADQPVRRVTLQLTPASVGVGNWRLHWIVVYLLASFVFIWLAPPLPHPRGRPRG